MWDVWETTVYQLWDLAQAILSYIDGAGFIF
jgi:hypothetical protein